MQNIAVLKPVSLRDHSPPIIILIISNFKFKNHLNMKKNTFLIIITMLFAVSANCQLDKRNWLVGGTGEFSTNESNGGKFSSLTLSPSCGYFLVDKLAVGVTMAFGYNKISTSVSKSKFTSLAIGPFIKYYFLEKEHLINLFVKGSYSYGNSWTYNSGNGNSHNHPYNNYDIIAGPVLFFNSSVGLEFYAGWHGFPKENNGVSNSFKMGMGFQIHLQK
jgi:hypothetical protein